MRAALPLVSAIVPAYNYARFLPAALDSALAQDYPPDRLEIVVIDDGSTDETPEVLAEYAARYPGRVRPIHQPNSGNIVATNRAFSQARGDYLAMLDADDTWLEHKTRAQVEILLARPEVALVHGDMVVTDAAGNITDGSLVPHYAAAPKRGRRLAALMACNQATSSSIMVRASLRPYFDPMPLGEGITFYDWWLAARAAIAGELDFLSEPCATYRIHGANDSGGATGARRVRELRRELAQQRWMLAHLELRHGLTAGDLKMLFDALHERAVSLLREAGTPFVELLAVTEADRERAAQWLAAGRASAAAGDDIAALHGFVKAFAWDPFDAEAREAFAEHAGHLAPVAVQSGAPTPPFLDAARSFRTLAFADELLEHPELLRSYGTCFGGTDDATLVISVDDPRLLEPLQRAVAEASLDGPDAADLLALSSTLDDRAEAALAGAVQAVLSDRIHHPRFPAPHLGIDRVPALRSVAERSWRRD